ncbi:host attachment family protein [Hyphomonas sp.]|uniref:host attachment family protein n=1 Tax=Hyphomonas sp. TaxID=87 RepID=UPI0025BB7E78|nr:host attachment family protein [Hyphomonas sp.]
MKLKTGMWVVVADGGHAIVFENQGTALAPELKALKVYNQDNPRTHEQGRDQPPRTIQSADGRRSAQEAPDLHQIAEDRFIDRIAADLAAEAARGAFKAIAVVAPPVSLGRFRKAASGELSKRVVAWIDKDLTKHPVPAIAEAVARAMED